MHPDLSYNITAQLLHMCCIIAALQHIISTISAQLQQVKLEIGTGLKHFLQHISAQLQHISAQITAHFSTNYSTFQHNYSTFQHILVCPSLTKRGLRFGFPKGNPNQKVWIILWQIMNILGLFGLVIAMGRLNLMDNSHFNQIKISGWYLVSLGFWSMLYDPIHFAVFMIIIC